MTTTTVNHLAKMDSVPFLSFFSNLDENILSQMFVMGPITMITNEMQWAISENNRSMAHGPSPDESLLQRMIGQLSFTSRSMIILNGLLLAILSNLIIKRHMYAC